MVAWLVSFSVDMYVIVIVFSVS